MRKLLLVFLMSGTALSAAPLSDTDVATANQLRDQATAGSDAYAIVESLVTEVGHRMAGSDHDPKGVAWAIAKFQQLGFDKVYTEPVSFPVWERGYAGASIVAPHGQTLNIAALGGSIGTPPGGVRAAVVSFADASTLQAAEPGSLKGKIAYISNRMTRAKDGAGYGPAVIARVQGAVFAARAGAAAVLIRSIGTDAAATPHTGMMRYDNMLTRIPAAALSNIDADLLERQLEVGPVEVKLELGSRVRNSSHVSANVIGEITGSEHPDEIVAIGGHLDSWDLGVGAIDNGAGVAITMAAGALIGRLEQSPKRTIRVIAFANEEQGVYGGKQYGKTHAPDLARHILGAESDFGGGRIWRFGSRVREDALPVVEQIFAVLQPMGIERGGNDAGGGADFSAMRDQGMPILGLDQDGTQYFDYHHTAADTLDKLNAADLDFNVAVYAATAYLAAQAGPVFGPVPLPPATP